MNKIIFFFVIYFIGSIQLAFSQSVYLLYDKSIPQAVYAAEMLNKALLEQEYSITKSRTDYDYMISIAVDAVKLGSEAYSIIPEGKIITIYGGDERGMIYGSLSLVEDLSNDIPLQKIEDRSESPNLSFRGIKFNLPWDSYRESHALDQHYETVRDLKYWEAFLDMMAENRFNALTLWNLHPFTYMIMPKNFPEASPFTGKELKEWQGLYRNIFRMARERGIDTYLVNWNIFVSREFAEAHNVAKGNHFPNFYTGGDTSEVVKRYIRESVTQVLEEYPNLSGFGLSVGEGMGGMTPQQRQDWINETIIEGMRLADRKSKLIHRAPFSADSGSGGSTSKSTEQITRGAIEEIDFIDGPIWVEMKFNWSHGHSSPELVKVHGGELGDTYFKPEPGNYKIVWTIRNEDFFALRWGVPNFIREHIANNTQESYVGGYFIGSETYIPAKDYFTAIDAPVEWRYAFERQWLFYKLWGRLLYNPDTPDEVFQAEFIRRYGNEAKNLLQAYALASSTPLRLASAFDLAWDFTLYSEGFMALNRGSMEYISVDRLISQPPLDPAYVSVDDFVTTRSSGGSFEEDRVMPPVLARMLERDCQKALRLVERISTDDDASLIYEVADVKTWANLGLHLAEKLRGAVALQTYRLEGGEENKRIAVEHMEKALGFWDEVIAITRPIYKDMPLTHYRRSASSTDNPHIGYNRNDDIPFHWEHIRPEVANDIQIARNATVGVAGK